MEKSVAEAVAEWADEVAEQQQFAQSLIEGIEAMGIDTSELDVSLVLDALAVDGLRLARMDDKKNIASLAYFDMLLPKT